MEEAEVKKDRLYDPMPDGVLYMMRLKPAVANWIDHRAGIEKVPAAQIIREIINEEYEHMAGIEQATTEKEGKNEQGNTNGEPGR